MYTIGISCWYHDSAACLLHNGDIVAAVQEERFTRIKHDSQFPVNAIRFCLDNSSLTMDDIDNVVFYEDSELKFSRLKFTWLKFFPHSLNLFFSSVIPWLIKKRDSVGLLYVELKKHDLDFPKSRIKYNEHHRSHAASAFFPSPFEDAAVLVMDGVGEFATTSIWKGNGNQLEKVKELKFPNSIGLLYSTITAYLGFRVNSGEYKVMGLAPYGEPVYVEEIRNLFKFDQVTGDFTLDMSYFGFPYSRTMFRNKLERLFGRDARQREGDLEQFHMDIASSLQKVTEELMQSLASKALDVTGSNNLCLAGGVALNCVGNGKILNKLQSNQKLWIQPASGDAGNALGAAYNYYYHVEKNIRIVNSSDSMKSAYLGPEYDQGDVLAMINDYGAVAQCYSYEELLDRVSDYLSEGKVIGWHQGRAEFGPRSLGNRSILGDSRNTEMQSTMNLKIKYRESFRPFAPAVLLEDSNDYFDLNSDSPYMLLVGKVQEKKRCALKNSDLFGIDKLKEIRSEIPAVTHIDYSARVQTVSPDTNRKFYDLIKSFRDKTGCSVLINTSFNVRGEPIVLTPADSYRCFMRTEMDVLVIENFIFIKELQPLRKEGESWKEEFVLD